MSLIIFQASLDSAYAQSADQSQERLKQLEAQTPAVDARRLEEIDRALRQMQASIEGMRREIKLIAEQAKTPALSARRRIADSVLDDLRHVDAAIDQYTVEKRKPAGLPITPTELTPYLKPGSTLAASCTDALGNPIGPLKTGSVPKVSEATVKALMDTVPPEFWGNYR